jgi:hypothetical protein
MKIRCITDEGIQKLSNALIAKAEGNFKAGDVVGEIPCTVRIGDKQYPIGIVVTAPTDIVQTETE